MRLSIPPTNGEGPNAVDLELQKALKVLREAHIQVDGRGIVGLDGESFGAVILRHESEAKKALETLGQAGVKASVS
jgi:hypothetical protein